MRAGVYVLQLRNGGYYVGKSENIDARVQQHTSGLGSAWCRHKGGVVKEVPTVFAGTLQDTASWEMNETVTQMLLHGYANVRGWEFCNCGTLTSGELDTIKNVIMGQTDVCRKCGNSGHFAHACNSSNVKAKWLLDLENLKKILSAAPSAMAMAAMSYERGQKKAVVSSNAAGGSGRALKGSAGNGSGNKGQCGISAKRGWGQGGRGGRTNGFSVRGGGVVKRSISRSALFCTRCGRATHIAANCYARCCVDGKKLDDSEDDDDNDDDNDDDDNDDDDNDEFSDEF